MDTAATVFTEATAAQRAPHGCTIPAIGWVFRMAARNTSPTSPADPIPRGARITPAPAIAIPAIGAAAGRWTLIAVWRKAPRGVAAWVTERVTLAGVTTAG